ncbi:restriction endonuclease subunit S [Micromonospora chokoriensis]
MVTSLVNRGSSPNYSETGTVRAISQAANQDAGIEWSRTRFHSYSGELGDLKGLLQLEDSIVNSTGTGTLGRVGIFTGSPDGTWCMADGHISIVRFRPDTVHPRFGYYWMRSQPFKEFLYEVLAVGATNQIELNRERLANAPIPVPAMEEQRRIVEFLDSQNQLIDELINRKRRMLSLLEERIDARILDLIGASSIANPRPGLPTTPIRRVLTKRMRPPSSSRDVVTAFRDGQVIARSKRRAEGYTMPATSDPQGQQVKIGEVVIHGLDGFAGAIGTSESDGNCSSVYHVCTPRSGGNALFLGRLLRTLAVSGYLGLFAISTRERAVDFRNWDLFGRIPIPDVSLEEQKEVGGWIDSVRPLRVTVERFNSLIEERRTAIITAAVTGRMSMTGSSTLDFED